MAPLKEHLIASQDSCSNVEDVAELVAGNPVELGVGQDLSLLVVGKIGELSDSIRRLDAVSDGIDFHALSDFTLVIVKPDRRIVYTGCQWSEIAESGELSEMVAERITLIAKKRVVTNP